MRRYAATLVLNLSTALGLVVSSPVGAVILQPAPTAALQASFDTDEAERLLAPGSGSLRGRLEVSYKKGLLSKKEIFVARHQNVTLLPMTSYLRAWEKKFGNDPVAYSIYIDPLATAFSARVMTDGHGAFEFRGLKAGRYLLITGVPYEADVTIRTDTGNTRYDINWYNSTITSSPIHREQRTRENGIHQIYTVIEIKEGSETLFQPR